MTEDARKRFQTIMDREKMQVHKTCPACGKSFNMGDPVVLACGAWEGPMKLIHENEAVFDPATSTYVEKKCWEAGGGKV